jgi:hypothetical protein
MSRLLDRFQAELDRRGEPMPGELEDVGVFADLMWPPCGDSEYAMSRLIEDPAFTITGYTRYVALACVFDEVRFFAAPIEPGSPDWWWSGERSEQAAAIDAESDEHEMAIFGSVNDAVTFVLAYLGGTSLRDVDVPRIKPTIERYEGRSQ